MHVKVLSLCVIGALVGLAGCSQPAEQTAAPATPAAAPAPAEPAPAEPAPAPAKPVENAKLEEFKLQAIADIDGMKDLTQQMVDQIYSYAEPGFQEFETSKYCVDILRKNGFTVEEGIAGIPTAFMATWGSGKPVIALGSDFDSLWGTSQTPGVPYRKPLIDEDAPGHGEGHNTGVPLSIVAAVAVKHIMEREKLQGTIKVWPGVAEELIAAKAFYVRAGYFKDVDLCIFSHVSSSTGTNYGSDGSNALVSIEYTFTGTTAHAGGSPWLGRSALDAVEIMDVAWNFRREHMPISQRSHNVLTKAGGQPNVVPGTAVNWYFFRGINYDATKEMWEIGNDIARGSALATGTKATWKLIGSGWDRHYNKPAAEILHANMVRVGMPAWSEDDQAFAKAVQRMLKRPEVGLAMKVGPLRAHIPEEEKTGGGSDDIGDISWNVPVARLNYAANIPNTNSHNWNAGIATATPIAHKGVTAAAKMAALTTLDYLLSPELVQQAWDYFKNVQTKDKKYVPFITPTDQPCTSCNEKAMVEYRERMRKVYFDSSKYKTYLEQLGVKYPMLQ